MAQETVTEYKTVEEQKTRTLCDNCNRTDEEAQILTVAINPKVEKESWEEIDVIETFDDEVVAHNKVREAKLEQASYTAQYGIGTVTHNHHKDMRASAKADVCSECVFDLFDIEIPEDEEVEEIELDNGELKINITKEVKTIWPQVNIPEWTNKEDKVLFKSGVLKILAWPLTLLFCFTDILGFCFSFNSELREERVRGYIGGSFGAILWTAIILGLMWFTSILVFAF